MKITAAKCTNMIHICLRGIAFNATTSGVSMMIMLTCIQANAAIGYARLNVVSKMQGKISSITFLDKTN